ncbi:MAG TPA: DegT/DnrJ/EryC1/StrS family aminotransferase, partial [Dongiaceae bacterium]|nr:DegT/DnrJ/EryC1/StrS family aminotransferase [Dongiaceae bacterium]
RPAAVVPVDLFGQPADYRAVAPIAAANRLFLLADAAQSFGADLAGRRVGTLGDATAVSFYPSKPLGCYGDGGAVLTDDDDLAARLRSLRVHGAGADKYDSVRIGLNGRLDTLQAAVLIEKLAIFPDEIAARRRVADRYGAALAGLVTVPRAIDGATSVWAQYTVLADDRDAVAARLEAAGVPTAVHYRLPLHRQPAYRGFPAPRGGLPVSERLAGRVLSLPLHAYLDAAAQDRVIDALGDALGSAHPAASAARARAR